MISSEKAVAIIELHNGTACEQEGDGAGQRGGQGMEGCGPDAKACGVYVGVVVGGLVLMFSVGLVWLSSKAITVVCWQSGVVVC